MNIDRFGFIVLSVQVRESTLLWCDHYHDINELIVSRSAMLFHPNPNGRRPLWVLTMQQSEVS
jgi:hypothetical protein